MPSRSGNAAVRQTATLLVRETTLLIALWGIIWITYFLHSHRFGLYEDDWYRIAKVVDYSANDLFSLIEHNFSSFALSQGRPFHPSLIESAAFVGFRLGGLWCVYCIAFALLATSCTLFYFLLRRMFGLRFALFGALAFATFPADTTRPFLTHALGLEPSLIFFLIAMHLYLSHRSAASYLTIFISLLTYETVFPVFLIAPLCTRSKQAEYLRHAAIMACLFLLVISVHAISGTVRTGHADVGLSNVLLPIFNMILGPITCLAMYGYRPIYVLGNLSIERALIVLMIIGLAGAVIYLVAPPIRRDGVGWNRPERLRPVIIGTLMLVAAYLLTVTTVGVAVAGRGTRVHFAAVLGASIVCAWLCCTLLDRYGSGKGLGIILGLFALLVGFGLDIQNDYVLAWQEQQGFWSEFAKLCPDLDDGVVIFVEPTGLRDTRQLLFLRHDLTGVPDSRQIKSLDIMYDILPELYKFPATWAAPPRVYRLPRNWQNRIFLGDQSLRVTSIEAGNSYAPDERAVPADKVIFLSTGNERLSRLATLPNPMGGEVWLKHLPASFSRLQDTGIDRYLFVDRPASFLAGGQ
jgi:hypothetical protein